MISTALVSAGATADCLSRCRCFALRSRGVNLGIVSRLWEAIEAILSSIPASLIKIHLGQILPDLLNVGFTALCHRLLNPIRYHQSVEELQGPFPYMAAFNLLNLADSTPLTTRRNVFSNAKPCRSRR